MSRERGDGFFTNVEEPVPFSWGVGWVRLRASAVETAPEGRLRAPRNRPAAVRTERRGRPHPMPVYRRGFVALVRGNRHVRVILTRVGGFRGA